MRCARSFKAWIFFFSTVLELPYCLTTRGLTLDAADFARVCSIPELFTENEPSLLSANCFLVLCRQTLTVLLLGVLRVVNSMRGSLRCLRILLICCVNCSYSFRCRLFWSLSSSICVRNCSTVLNPAPNTFLCAWQKSDFSSPASTCSRQTTPDAPTPGIIAWVFEASVPAGHAQGEKWPLPAWQRIGTY